MNVLPLHGVRVLDFSHVWAGPFCARLLGDFGAEVIKVESVSRTDPERGPARIIPGARMRLYPDGDPGERPYNRAGRFNAYNRNKLGLTLDLRSDEGRELIQELVKVSDIVVENFSVGVMNRLGLDYESCRELRPDIICISLPGFGSTGPEKGYAAYGLTQEAMSGLSGVTGYPGEVPIDTGVFYGDPTGGLFGAAAVSTALWHRMQTGEGQRIDLSQREAFATVLPELVFEHTMNDRVMSSVGNRHPRFAPHGVYPCQGEEAWVAITATTDVQFEALRDVMGLAVDSRFVAMANRKANEDALDALIRDWTGRHEQYDTMHRLQERGVPAGAVLSNRQIHEDPHFQARGFFEEVTHPDAGTHAQIGMPWKMSETPVHIRLPAPGLGQHNDFVLGEVLGLSADELQSLLECDVIGTEPLSARR
ncbi:MAG: CoA transferase [SAR202 cluster bacterium]|nr:CoA transferase [SAR202 cluster bacterium]